MDSASLCNLKRDNHYLWSVFFVSWKFILEDQFGQKILFTRTLFVQSWVHNIFILLTSMAKFTVFKKNSGFKHPLFCCLLHLTKQPPCFGKIVWKPFILLFSSLENLWIFQTSSNPVWRTWDGRRDSMKTLNRRET